MWLAHGFSDWIFTAGPWLLDTVISRRRWIKLELYELMNLWITYLYSVQTNVCSRHTECSEVLNAQPTLTITWSLQRLHSFLTDTELSPVV